jgi:hypothetical protein
MNLNQEIRHASRVQGEILSRWPTLTITALDSGIRTTDALAVPLSEQMGFCEKHALMEAHGFWKDLEERFRLAA